MSFTIAFIIDIIKTKSDKLTEAAVYKMPLSIASLRYFHGQKQTIWKLKIHVYWCLSSFISDTLLTILPCGEDAQHLDAVCDCGFVFICGCGVVYPVFFRPERECCTCLSLLQ
jgi:hypothetical protein